MPRAAARPARAARILAGPAKAASHGGQTPRPGSPTPRRTGASISRSCDDGGETGVATTRLAFWRMAFADRDGDRGGATTGAASAAVTAAGATTVAIEHPYGRRRPGNRPRAETDRPRRFRPGADPGPGPAAAGRRPRGPAERRIRRAIAARAAIRPDLSLRRPRIAGPGGSKWAAADPGARCDCPGAVLIVTARPGQRRRR